MSSMDGTIVLYAVRGGNRDLATLVNGGTSRSSRARLMGRVAHAIWGVCARRNVYAEQHFGVGLIGLGPQFTAIVIDRLVQYMKTGCT